jgi:hypothetical protein
LARLARRHWRSGWSALQGAIARTIEKRVAGALSGFPWK